MQKKLRAIQKELRYKEQTFLLTREDFEISDNSDSVLESAFKLRGRERFFTCRTK
jgi:hypothetical protein